MTGLHADAGQLLMGSSAEILLTGSTSIGTSRVGKTVSADTFGERTRKTLA